MQQTSWRLPPKAFLFLQLTRPIFLAGGILLYAFGAVAAHAAGYPIDWKNYLIGQILVTCIQLFAQYSNEYFDFNTDKLNANGRTWFSGGSGVLEAGGFSERTAFHAARVTGITALALVLGLSFENPIISLIGFLAIAGSWFYSAPPLSLVGSGFGEFIASIIVCALVPFTGTIMQTSGELPVTLAGVLPLLLIHSAMLIVFSLPDYEADQKTGKETLVVRIGRLRAAAWHHRLILLGYTLLAVQVLTTLSPARLAWATLPFAIVQMRTVSRYAHHPTKNPNSLTLGAVALFSLISGLLTLDVYLAR